MTKVIGKKEVETIQKAKEVTKEITQSAKVEIVDVEKVTIPQTSVKPKQLEVQVTRILQKLPSGYKLLLETGEIVRVNKAQYSKGQPSIILQ